MFAGFNLSLSQKELQKVNGTGEGLYDFGKNIVKSNNNEIHKSLLRYLMNEESLSAAAIENDWFKEVDANIFISHSHKDFDLVCGLASYLYCRYRIKCFIDSTVWGYANDLLEIIDDRYSWNSSKGLYNYEKTQYSSSHVHMLLNGALMKMMDKTECIIFLNSPNTITFRDSDDNAFTDSPWVYSELLMSRLLRRKELKEYRQEKINEFAHGFREDELSILYKVKTDHFVDLSFGEIHDLGRIGYSEPEEYLDQLYRDKNLID